LVIINIVQHVVLKQLRTARDQPFADPWPVLSSWKERNSHMRHWCGIRMCVWFTYGDFVLSRTCIRLKIAYSWH